MKFFISLFTTLFLFYSSQATPISGTVTDEKGNALPYVNVYIKELYKGTTSNADGFYKLDVAEGNYTLVFKFLGYKTESKLIAVFQDPLLISTVLLPENFELKAVTINSGGEDPAYQIIRNAIKKRKFYLDQVEAYSCRVYIKGVQKLIKYPEKFLGNRLNFGAFLDSTTGIFYLSESVSNFDFKKPDKIREEMISSRISGNNQSFSYNKASDMLFNFYENNVMGRSISDRGFISPIATSALFYYRYKLLGSTIENDLLIHKIEMTPRRNADPVFRGIIYIADSAWRIQNLDVYLTSAAGIEFVDTLRIRQTFLPVDDTNDIWMPVDNRFDFSFKFLGFRGGGNYTGYFSEFVMNPTFEKKTFTAEILKVNDDANKRDSAYWRAVRPMELTLEERIDYAKKDSMQVVRESKSFNDSLDRITNKFSISGYILSGHTHQNRYKKSSLHFSSLIENVQYNTVEGWYASLDLDYNKRFVNRKRYMLKANMRYGFSNKHFNAFAGGRYNYDRKNSGFYSASAGSKVAQLNQDNPISPTINTLYTFLAEQNFLKLFEKRFVQLETGRELFNGFYSTLKAEWAKRLPLQNTALNKWKNVDGREFTPNTPYGTLGNAFETHYTFIAGIDFRYRIGQKYISRPDIKIAMDSKYPDLSAGITQGISGVFESNVNYTKINFGFNHHLDFGMIGYLVYKGDYSFFPVARNYFIVDMQHFKGNQTIFSAFPLDGFNVLDYYAYSTIKPSFAVHSEYHFNKFITNKIPLLRKLKLDEVIGFHYLHVDGLPEHFEFSAGFEKLGLFRVDYVQSFTGNKLTHAVRFGLKITR